MAALYLWKSLYLCHMKSTKTLATLISHIGRYKTPAILTPVFTLGEVVIDVLIPYVTAMLIDQGILAGDMQKIYFFGTIMIGMAFLSLFLGIEAGRMSAKASSGFAFNLRKAIYDNIQTFSFTNIDKYSTSGLITRMTTDITMLQTAFQMVLRITIRAPFSLVLAIFMCLFINVRTSLIFIVALIILSAFLVFIINKVTPLFIETFKKYDALNASTQENIAAMRVVKAFVREDYERMILMSLMMVSMIFVMLTMSAASANRVVTVINEKADIVSPDNSINEVKDGSVKFENVSFSYEKGSGDYVISDINLEFRSGERIGVIGATASGKSSLVLLISRLYDVSKGKVEVSGNDVRDYDLKTLRDSVAVVLQQNLLFKGTILENLRWGNKNATLKECKEACILACADDFINQMPEGYNTLITQGGTNVSGGQRQRLCLARALLKHPKILILDDATSACDTATDACIRENLRTKLPSMTQIIISQRVNTVMECDKILVFQSGKVNGIGTHEELMEKNEIYKEFYSIQLESGGDFDSPEQKGGTDEEI